MNTNPDDRCITRYKHGDIAAFDELYAKYRQRVFGYLYKSTYDQAIADDLFQEVWVRVIAGLARYEAKGQFRQWIITCAHNVIVDHYRKQKKLQTTDSLSKESEFISDPLVEHATSDPNHPDLALRIEQAVKTLPFDQRQAFHLREQLACSIRDVAEIQNCSLEAAKSRLRYAYKKLRTELKDFKEEPSTHE